MLLAQRNKTLAEVGHKPRPGLATGARTAGCAADFIEPLLVDTAGVPLTTL